MRAVVLAVLAVSCKGADHPTAPPLPHDPHSYAEPERVAVRHLSLELTVDFKQRVLSGTAKLQLTRRDRDAPLRLDTSDLTVDTVTDCATPTAFALDTPHRVLGRQLVIQKPPECVAITYRTSPDARALLWVETNGTLGKNHPMLFTQSQAILARSWVPLQDTPSVRFTYDATIHVPPKLWALMSAENPQAPAADGVWRFRMQQPIPSYLMALAVGDFAFRSLGPRSGVYAEPALIDAAAKEFAEVEQMMAVAEKLYGPYRWGRYDMLVLPPSFPYGGMENPRLTFLTPTAITGDRSLVSLIAHELAHSWSGNLVTNATWSDFWLNEGFTTYVERRIMEELRGKDEAALEWHIGDTSLIRTFGKSPGPDTRLALDVSDRDPDDVPSDSAYEKGALFLRTLEETFGRAELDAFLRRRFERLAFTSTTTAVFERDVVHELIERHPGKLTVAQLAAWLHDPGLPAGTLPKPSRRFDELIAKEKAFLGGEVVDIGKWTTLEIVVFLDALDADHPPLKLVEQLADLDGTENAELLMHWLPIVVRADYVTAAPVVEHYLLTVGRRRMIRPLYAAMVEKGGTWKELAQKTFVRARPLYHPIVRDTIANLVGN